MKASWKGAIGAVLLLMVGIEIAFAGTPEKRAQNMAKDINGHTYKVTHVQVPKTATDKVIVYADITAPTPHEVLNHWEFVIEPRHKDYAMAQRIHAGDLVKPVYSKHALDPENKSSVSAYLKLKHMNSVDQKHADAAGGRGLKQ